MIGANIVDKSQDCGLQNFNELRVPYVPELLSTAPYIITLVCVVLCRVVF